MSLAAKVEQAKNMVGDEQRAKEFVKHNQALPGVEKDNEAQYQVNNAKQASDYFISTRILAVIALIATIIMVIVVAPLFSAGRGISLLGRHVAEIGITTPQTGTRVYLNESLVVVGSAQGEGITRLDLLVDGKLNKSEFAPDTSNGADFLSISLGWPAESAGTHQLEVLAYTNFTGQPIARSEVITLEVRIP